MAFRDTEKVFSMVLNASKYNYTFILCWVVCRKLLTGGECRQAVPLWTTSGHVPDFRVCRS